MKLYSSSSQNKLLLTMKMTTILFLYHNGKRHTECNLQTTEIIWARTKIFFIHQSTMCWDNWMLYRLSFSCLKKFGIWSIREFRFGWGLMKHSQKITILPFLPIESKLGPYTATNLPLSWTSIPRGNFFFFLECVNG